MKKTKTLISLLLLMFMIMQLFGCSVSVPVQKEISSADEANAVGLSATNVNRVLEVGAYDWLDVNIKIDYNYALKWSSDNPEVASVDSNGRVDAIAPGKALITARLEKSYVQFNIVVKEAAKKEVNTSTAILSSANKLLVDQNKTNAQSRNMYALIVNVDTNCITVYTYNSQGIYNVGVRSMVCSSAKDYSVYEIREGAMSGEVLYYHIDDKIGNKDGWSSFDEEENYRYRTNFSLNGEDGFSFTSCLYNDKSAASLNAADYNKLGTNYTDGDIRLSVNDAKWIFENCQEGTQIRFVTSSSLDLLGVPTPIRIAEEAEIQNWDPTDPDKRNPYLKKAPTFTGMEDLYIGVNDVCDLKDGVEVYDTCMNLIPDAQFKIDSNISRNKAGTYVVTYTYTDILKRTGRADRVVHVEY